MNFSLPLILCSLFALLGLFSCEENTGASDGPSLLSKQEVQAGHIPKDLSGKNQVSFELPSEAETVFLQVESRGEIFAQYEQKKQFHSFGDYMPGGGHITVALGCQVIYETFKKKIYDLDSRIVLEEDVSFYIDGKKLEARMIKEEPTIFEIHIPEKVPSVHEGQVRRFLTVVNSTFQIFPLSKRDLSDCYAKGYPDNRFDIIGLKNLEQGHAKDFGGKSLNLILLEKLP